MHKSVDFVKQHFKKLQERLKYCNASKVGVDILNQMAWQHTCKSGLENGLWKLFFKS